MESRPSPSGPKSGSSSPICSGVTWSIRFLTSISLIWARKSDSDINERGFCRKLRVRSNVQNVRVLTSGKRREDACELPKHFVQDRRERFRRVAYVWKCAIRRHAGFEKLARPDRLYRREGLLQLPATLQWERSGCQFARWSTQPASRQPWQLAYRTFQPCAVRR